jgi:hypothetical protein
MNGPPHQHDPPEPVWPLVLAAVFVLVFSLIQGTIVP